MRVLYDWTSPWHDMNLVQLCNVVFKRLEADPNVKYALELYHLVLNFVVLVCLI